LAVGKVEWSVDHAVEMLVGYLEASLVEEWVSKKEVKQVVAKASLQVGCLACVLAEQWANEQVDELEFALVV